MFRLIQDHQQEEQPLKLLMSHNSYSQLPDYRSFGKLLLSVFWLYCGNSRCR